MTEHVSAGPDPRDGRVGYEMPEGLALAVEVALATDRPLLLRGEPGSGKSSLAPFYARQHGLRYYEHVVTSRTQATDLLWTFDSVRRLADAQIGAARGQDSFYVRPGVLWWSLAPESAGRLNQGNPHELFASEYPGEGAVVLIDEIDKADTDVPNSLLVPLGSQEFTVAETGVRVTREPGVARHLTVITTNEERELPQAFLRRCVTFTLPDPTPESLTRIAARHLEHENIPIDEPLTMLISELADELIKARVETSALRERRPSTAEFLDALRACRTLGIGPGDDRWAVLRGLTLIKPQHSDR